jgi:hypothetical protein
MYATTESGVFIQTVHGTSFPLVGLTRISQSTWIKRSQQAESDAEPINTSTKFQQNEERD